MENRFCLCFLFSSLGGGGLTLLVSIIPWNEQCLTPCSMINLRANLSTENKINYMRLTTEKCPCMLPVNSFIWFRLITCSGLQGQVIQNTKCVFVFLSGASLENKLTMNFLFLTISPSCYHFSHVITFKGTLKRPVFQPGVL